MKQQTNHGNQSKGRDGGNNAFARALARALVRDWQQNGITRNLRFKNSKGAK